MNSKKQANCAILSKDNLVGNHNMIIVENYIYIFFEEYVYIYNYMEEQPIRKTKFKFFSKISNIINISSDKILILFYNKQKKEIFTIREYHVYLGEYKTAKFDCIGEGFIQLKMVKQIINIDDHKILIKEIKGPLLIIVKISEISQLFKRNYNKYNSDNVDMNDEFILDESQDEINKNEINNINIRSNLDNKQKEEINLDINNNIINIKENSINVIKEKSEIEGLKIENIFRFGYYPEKKKFKICKQCEHKIEIKRQKFEISSEVIKINIIQKINKTKNYIFEICYKEVQITVAKTIKNKDFQIIRIINNNLFNSQEEEEDSAKIINDIKNKIEVLKKLLESKKINKNDLKDFDNLITPIKLILKKR